MAARVAEDVYIFNPLAPCGARQGKNACVKFPLIFQSTRPLRGETASVKAYDSASVFSIHSPLAGRDTKVPLWDYNDDVFQSTRPLRGETEQG